MYCTLVAQDAVARIISSIIHFAIVKSATFDFIDPAIQATLPGNSFSI